MIEAQGLSKFYGDFIAVRDITFTVPHGQVAAFVGANGAGKTTTMKLLTGFLAPSSGTARISGFDVSTERILAASRLGYLPENGPLYLDMTPREMLRFLGHARGMGEGRLEERLKAVVELCSLQEIYEKPIHKLSKGNRQRVGMAQALLHEPEVLIMDEPTGGLDPNQIKAVRHLIRDFGKTGAVLLSTHIMQEVEALADRVIFINEGAIVFDGSIEAFRAKGAKLEEVFGELTRRSETHQQAAATEATV